MNSTCYSREHCSYMSWQEFGNTLELLLNKIEKYIHTHNITFDAVIPILRSGGIPASAIAIHFNILHILPIQFKFFGKKNHKCIMPPKKIKFPSPTPHFLICETNTSSGKTAQKTINIIKKQYPSAKIYYSTIAKVYGGPNFFEGIEEYFYGIQTNENFIASADKEKKLGLRPSITIFPWEIVDIELKEIND